MNDAFIALNYRDELSDTLFFAGLSNVCSREVVRGKKAYVFKNDGLDLTIVGRSITINGQKMRSCREAKQYIAERSI
jgi:hypothetical protein